MLNRAVAPAFQKSTQLSLLSPQPVALPNGNTLFVLSGGTQEVIHVELVVPAGKWYEPATGVSHFTALQLDKGTKTKSSFQIASFFDSLGAHIEITPGNDFITIGVYSLTRHIEEVLKWVVHLLVEPAFPAEELQLAKSIALQNLKVNDEKTSYVAGKLFRKALFGEHPYGIELNEAAIQKIQREELARYHAAQIRQFTAIASGNISDTLARALASILAKLPSTTTGHGQKEFAVPAPSSAYYPKEGSVQTTIRFGRRIVNRQHADFFDLLFLTHLLGGYFGSRLMKNIREEKGLTYGIYASVQPLVRDAFFVIGADVNRENRELTLLEIKAELNRLCHDAVGEEELTTARNHFIGSLQAEVTTVFAQGDKFKTVLLNELSPAFYQQMINRVESITPYDLQRTGEKYFNTTLFTEVSVG
jgi:zinc protease